LACNYLSKGDFMDRKLLLAVILLTGAACGHHQQGNSGQRTPQAEPATPQASLERARTAEADLSPGDGDDPVSDTVGQREREREARATARDLERADEDSAGAGSEGGAAGTTTQGTDKADLDLTERVRRGLNQDNALSFSGKNVQVISNDGVVTLRGLVSSQAEKRAVFKRASAEAGHGQVKNLLEVRNQE
jgi:osmotically-inducible protein OsmY